MTHMFWNSPLDFLGSWYLVECHSTPDVGLFSLNTLAYYLTFSPSILFHQLSLPARLVAQLFFALLGPV